MPVQRQSRVAALAKRSEVKGVPPLKVKEEVVVIRRRPGAALVNGGIEHVGWGVGKRQRDRTHGGVCVTEALDGQCVLQRRRGSRLGPHGGQRRRQGAGAACPPALMMARLRQ